MAWTITVAPLPRIAGVGAVARDGLRRILHNHGLAYCSNFAADAPRREGQTPLADAVTLTPEQCEQLWRAAQMHRAAVKRARKTNPYAGRPCFH
jgi:hypothetical protein